MRASVLTRVDGVCTPADLSVCRLLWLPRGCSRPHLSTLPPLAHPCGTPGPGAVSGRPGLVLTGGCIWWGPQGRWPHQSPPGGGSRKMGKCFPLPRKRTPPPESRSRWEASGSPHLAVIHAGCAGAFTAEQRPAPRGAGRSGEASGSPGLLDCSCLLRGKLGPRTALAGAPPPPSVWKEWDSERPRPAPRSACWPGGSPRPVPCGRASERAPRVLCCVTGHPSAAFAARPGRPSPTPPVCPPVKSSAQLAGFPWQQQ